MIPPDDPFEPSPQDDVRRFPGRPELEQVLDALDHYRVSGGWEEADLEHGSAMEGGALAAVRSGERELSLRELFALLEQLSLEPGAFFARVFPEPWDGWEEGEDERSRVEDLVDVPALLARVEEISEALKRKADPRGPSSSVGAKPIPFGRPSEAEPDD